MTNRCAWCYGPLPADHPKTVHVVRLDGGVGGVVELRWHVLECMGFDPLHTGALADALSMPDGPESDDATRCAYGAIRDRAAAHDRDNPHRAPVLPQVVRIRRDTQSWTETLRNHSAWGRLSPRRTR